MGRGANPAGRGAAGNRRDALDASAGVKPVAFTLTALEAARL
jgi:hypothetical protein